MLEIAFRPDPGRREPVYRQLERNLRALIESGRVVAGERLPPSRELAETLSISRNSVNRAYRALLDEGLVRARVGQGTFVAARGGPRPAAAAAAEVGSADAPARGFAWEGLLSARARRRWPPGVHATRRPGVPVRFDFQGGRVDPELFPLGEWRRVWSRALAERASELAEPGHPYGLRALREEIALALVARGIACEPEHVLVVNGTQHALDLVSKTLVDPGDVVVMENPGYFGAIEAFGLAGAELVGVGVDERGLLIDELAKVLRSRRAKLVYTTPSAQFPTGAVLGEARRSALLELADEHHVPVFEDDYDSELRFEGPPLPALKTRDPAGRVIYAGTFAKALFPGLRLGYVVAAPPLLARLASARVFGDFASDAVAQAAVAGLLASGSLERHVRRTRRVIASRREALLAALEAHMPESARWTKPAGGHTVWVRLPDDVDPDALALASGEAGIVYARGDACSLDGSGAGFASLAFASQTPERITEGVACWARVMSRVRARRTA
ncbi:MAG: PLP-dependent aminotransferase family protein [Myxococcota bacterium]